jgi:dihydrofolate reductase
VYGGATFVASLIEHDLIDELHFFVNPVAIGEGLRIFKDRKPLKLRACTTHTNGVVVTSYSAR